MALEQRVSEKEICVGPISTRTIAALATWIGKKTDMIRSGDRGPKTRASSEKSSSPRPPRSPSRKNHTEVSQIGTAAPSVAIRIPLNLISSVIVIGRTKGSNPWSACNRC